jgi:hypothetical protein
MRRYPAIADADVLRWLTAEVIAYRITRVRPRRIEVATIPTKPRNLLRLAGIINTANTEADNEAGELIERVRKNKARTLGLIAKGHHNEALREQMLSEAEKEQALADLAAAVGDNGGPLLAEEPDEAEIKLMSELKAAKSAPISASSDTKTAPPAVGETDGQTFQPE